MWKWGWPGPQAKLRPLKEQVDPRCCCSCPTAEVNPTIHERWVYAKAGQMPGENGSKERLGQGGFWSHSPKERVNHVPWNLKESHIINVQWYKNLQGISVFLSFFSLFSFFHFFSSFFFFPFFLFPLSDWKENFLSLKIHNHLTPNFYPS